MLIANGASGKDKVRIDKWLWAARFYKTRSLATQAVAGGMVQMNDDRIKPSRLVQPGDELRILRGDELYVVTVLGLAVKRGPARQAVLLYEESTASMAAREQASQQRRLLAAQEMGPIRRPNKRERRKIVNFTKRYE